MKTAYFDCFSGASGDMILGSLVYAGLSPRLLREAIKKLRIPSVGLKITKVLKGGISGDETTVMKFRVTALVGDTDPMPATLRAVARLSPASSVRTRDFRLKKSGPDMCGGQNWKINDLGWHDIAEYPELGTVEIWRFINDSGVSHPMHMHLVAFQVLDRDGFTKGPLGEIIPTGNPQPPAAEENGWKDTAMVAPNQILRVIAKFENYKGFYAYHCHILEHEDSEMMEVLAAKFAGMRTVVHVAPG